MKLYFMKRDALDYFKTNMDRLYVYYYQDKTNEWMTREYGDDPFSLFMDVPDFELAKVSDMTIGEADFNNCKILYDNLRNISESQGCDERLWAGLCNGTFYSVVRERYDYDNMELKKKDTDASAVISRFFFSGGTSAGLYRNCLSKCWWVGRTTYDKKNTENHYERLDIIGPNDLTTKVSDIFYSNNFSSNPIILTGICDALKYFKDKNQILNEKAHVRASMKYLNAVGGAVLLDVMTSEDISKLLIDYIESLLNGDDTDIADDSNDVDDVLED